jgi:deoxycytidylate deaminase
MKPSEIFDTLFKLAVDTEYVANAKIVSLITVGRKVISFGSNKYKTHPMQLKFSRNCESVFLHAEIDAIVNALRRLTVDELRKCNLYVLRVKKASRNGPFITGKSMPCDGCMRAINAFNLKNVFYVEENASKFLCMGVE